MAGLVTLSCCVGNLAERPVRSERDALASLRSAANIPIFDTVQRHVRSRGPLHYLLIRTEREASRLEC
jgi:hypothetical protein